jgi:hypothetical protein
MLCYNYHKIKNKRRTSYLSKEGEEENPPKRIAVKYNDEDEVDNDFELPLYDYIAFAKNLHVPSLYQCVLAWYKLTYPDHDENNIEPVYNVFLDIFDLFVDGSNIKDCTFAESTEDNNPITMDQLERLINHGKKVDLEYLNLGYFQCNSDDLSKITGKCNNLRTFKISAQRCSDEALAEFIRSQNRLTKLKIRNAKKIDLTLEALGSQSESLVKIRVLSSSLESCRKPFNGIAVCSKLRSIYMRKTSWPIDISISSLLMPIAKQCEFHNVDFSNTYLPADVLVEFAKKSSSTLRKVHLIGTEDQIDHDKFDLSTGIRALANHCKNIVHFERDIIPKEINSLIYFIDTIGKSLVRLEIESQLMRDCDASRLIDSISYCTKLEILNISFFIFASQVFENLLSGCKSLTTLTICNSNSVNDDILKIIRDKRNLNLKTLDIYACDQVTEDAVDQLRAETGLEVGYGYLYIYIFIKMIKNFYG